MVMLSIQVLGGTVNRVLNEEKNNDLLLSRLFLINNSKKIVRNSTFRLKIL